MIGRAQLNPRGQEGGLYPESLSRDVESEEVAEVYLKEDICEYLQDRLQQAGTHRENQFTAYIVVTLSSGYEYFKKLCFGFAHLYSLHAT